MFDCAQLSGWVRIGTKNDKEATPEPPNCAQLSGWVRIGTEVLGCCFSKSQLRPAFGLGEDWNTEAVKPLLGLRLRPAFGLGEDWNQVYGYLFAKVPNCAQLSGWVRIGTDSRDRHCLGGKRLRPAFGLGEDWNHYGLQQVNKKRKLRPAFGLGEDWNLDEPSDVTNTNIALR